MSTTTERGDEFRDTVRDLLEAAGFRCDIEVRTKYKKVDIVAVRFDPFNGLQTILVEAKNYAKNITKDEVNEFINEYGLLIKRGEADRAWLISTGGISSDARSYFDNLSEMSFFTFSELQRRLFDMSLYIKDIIDLYERERIENFYLPPHTKDNEDLATVVERWLNERGAEPLAIMGGYGIGKTTFARHLAYTLGKQSLSDANSRIPVLIPLGEVFDDQTISGLVGKVLADQHRVGNYHFGLFESLNAGGRFVIIFDGFDEMKHGLTISRFERNVNEFMKLDKGDAKLIILGRDTAFQTDVEFRSVIQGQKRTAIGFLAASRERRSLRPVSLRGFTIEEARFYVNSYFSTKVAETSKADSTVMDSAWVERRKKELLDGSLDELLARPVHAQMLCEIATQPNVPLSGISKFQLYDLFVHYLLEREVNKRGRFPGFNIEVRRKFNVALAAWLWERGGASTTTFADIPDKLCNLVAQDIVNDFDPIGLRRELIAGCLADKGEQTIYFSHRSIQEFLVAEFIVSNGSTYLIPEHGSSAEELFRDLISLLNHEIVDFIVGMLKHGNRVGLVLDAWLPQLRTMRFPNVPLIGLELISRLIAISARKINPWLSPWDLWLLHFVHFGRADPEISNSEIPWATRILDESFEKGEEAKLSAILYWAYCIQIDQGNSSELMSILVSRMLVPGRLTLLLDLARDQKDNYFAQRQFLTVRYLLQCLVIQNDNTNNTMITLDIGLLISIVSKSLSISFEREITAEDLRTIRVKSFCTIDAVLKSNLINGASPNSIDAITRFFRSDDLRNRMKAAVVGQTSIPSSIVNRPRMSGTITSRTDKTR